MKLILPNKTTFNVTHVKNTFPEREKEMRNTIYHLHKEATYKQTQEMRPGVHNKRKSFLLWMFPSLFSVHVPLPLSCWWFYHVPFVRGNLHDSSHVSPGRPCSPHGDGAAAYFGQHFHLEASRPSAKHIPQCSLAGTDDSYQSSPTHKQSHTPCKSRGLENNNVQRARISCKLGSVFVSRILNKKKLSVLVTWSRKLSCDRALVI